MTYKELGEKVAEQALDDYLINGKTMREWINILSDNMSVLERIRAEIETKYGHCDICEYFEDYDYEENDISEYRPIGNIADVLQIIDKYKGDKE